MRKLSPSISIKTVIHKVNCRIAAREGGLGHAPGFYDFALQNLFPARFRAKHCVLEKINFIDRLKGTPLACLSRPSGTPRTHCVRNFLPYFGLAKTGRTGLPQQAA